jgi:hypothetical protein
MLQILTKARLTAITLWRRAAKPGQVTQKNSFHRAGGPLKAIIHSTKFWNEKINICMLHGGHLQICFLHEPIWIFSVRFTIWLNCLWKVFICNAPIASFWAGGSSDFEIWKIFYKFCGLLVSRKKHLYFISVSGAFLGISLPPTPNWSRFDLFIDVYSIEIWKILIFSLSHRNNKNEIEWCVMFNGW